MPDSQTQRPVLVLLHAFPLDSRMWEPQRSALADYVDLITPDLPGFGLAPGFDEESLTMARAAEIVEAELDAREIERCILGGLSMGGYIAFECWRRFSSRIDGLLLADTKATPDTEGGRNKRFSAAERIGHGEYLLYVEELLGTLLSESTRREHPAVEIAVRAIAQSTTPTAAISGLLGMASRADSSDLLDGIHVPAALIFGEHDAVTTVDEGRGISHRIPNATLTIVPEAGHLSNIENPHAFNHAVIDLIAAVTSAPARR